MNYAKATALAMAAIVFSTRCVARQTVRQYEEAEKTGFFAIRISESTCPNFRDGDIYVYSIHQGMFFNTNITEVPCLFVVNRFPSGKIDPKTNPLAKELREDFGSVRYSSDYAEFPGDIGKFHYTTPMVFNNLVWHVKTRDANNHPTGGFTAKTIGVTFEEALRCGVDYSIYDFWTRDGRCWNAERKAYVKPSYSKMVR